MKTDTMTATDAITTLPQLLQALGTTMEDLALTVADVQGQWDRLRKIGANRDDHGAELLKSVRRLVGRLHATSGRIEDQLDTVIANPFGD
jgi:hypothetical protein